MSLGEMPDFFRFANFINCLWLNNGIMIPFRQGAIK